MVWCTFDPAGRSWVKMKNYQRTMKDGQRKYQYKRSGSHHRNWRQRRVTPIRGTPKMQLFETSTVVMSSCVSYLDLSAITYDYNRNFSPPYHLHICI